jgi:hypothetical protein
VSYPDSVALFESQQAWQAAQQAPGYGGEQGLPTHDIEIMSSHSGLPSVATQDRVNGAGLPSIDRGTLPGTVVG